MHRKWFVILGLVFSLFVVSASSALTTNSHACCADGCKGMVLCTSASCQTCSSVNGLVGAAPLSPPPMPAAVPAVTVARAIGNPLFELWKPPKS